MGIPLAAGGIGGALLDHVNAAPAMSQMTYGGIELMSRFQYDIRPLLSPLPGTILRPMEPRSSTGLEVCLVCGQDFVSMARSRRAGNGTWWLLLRCGACGTWHETLARDEAVAALQRAIKQGLRAVADALNRLELERMGSQVEAFTQALERDLIGPDDFQSASDAAA
jgi:hypothetical protein